ncbi:hypothetical protein D7W81_33810 [Corallococcus aberystwythensis]|uniref:Uncharacterized protein n=1 Tax=Corallococcus aberystwythensis TaxID=2316722 RepID=A0A3A8PJC5_9BACT|nr:hypothetical protein D7W81_33810 [Corallococcus aberystwythensis]
MVENYLLPKQFLPQFTKSGTPDLSKQNWRHHGGEGQIHGNAQGGSDSNAYFLKEQRLGIVTDSWALTEDADISPSDSSGEMYDRVETVYTGVSDFNTMQSSFQDFRSGLTEELLDDTYLMMFEDKPTRPYLSIHPHLAGMQTPANDVEQEGQGRRYFNQEWRDWDDDKNQNTYQHGERGNWYMGCKDAESC